MYLLCSYANMNTSLPTLERQWRSHGALGMPLHFKSLEKYLDISFKLKREKTSDFMKKPKNRYPLNNFMFSHYVEHCYMYKCFTGFEIWIERNFSNSRTFNGMCNKESPICIFIILVRFSCFFTPVLSD